MKKVILIFIILCYIPTFSQNGGRKLEKTKISTKRRKHVKGNTSWVYRKTESGPVQDRELPKLFKRKKTRGGEENERIIKRQNNLRVKKRVRGNDVFHKRKYF